MVNWPTTWSPAIRAARELIASGTIGTVWEVRWRNGASLGPLAYGTGADEVTETEKAAEWWHQAAPGGGALLDYCCYGACLSRWYFGEPAVAATALAANLGSHFGSTEDNAVVAVRFPKALALLEGSWTTLDPGVPGGPIVYGSEGTLVVEQQGDRQVVRLARGRGAAPESFEPEPLPAGRQDVAQECVHHLTTGEPLHPTLRPDFNLEAMAILDAGARSARSGKLELVQDIRWCVE